MDIAQIQSTMQGLALAAEALGTVDGTANFATGLERARVGLGQAAGHEVADRRGKHQRTSVAARLSGLLTDDTTGIAASGAPPLTAPGSILEQMGR